MTNKRLSGRQRWHSGRALAAFAKDLGLVARNHTGDSQPALVPVPEHKHTVRYSYIYTK